MKAPLGYRSPRDGIGDQHPPQSFLLAHLLEFTTLVVGLSGAFTATQDQVFRGQFAVGVAMSVGAVLIAVLLVLTEFSRIAQWMFRPGSASTAASIRFAWRLLVAAIVVIASCQVPSCH